ncbi:MAG: hypothetical protein WAR79_00120 [Melioribacteraceae bacterium]
MSVQTKSRFKNLGKIIGIFLFATFMFTNIKVALLSDDEIIKGELNLLGYNIELFSPAAAATTTAVTGTCCTENGSLCIVGEHVFDNKYYKAEGPCK